MHDNLIETISEKQTMYLLDNARGRGHEVGTEKKMGAHRASGIAKYFLSALLISDIFMPY